MVFVFLITFFLFEEYKIWFYTESSKVLVLHLLTGWLRTNNTIFVFQLLLTNQVVGICQTFMRMTDVGHTVISKISVMCLLTVHSILLFSTGIT